MESRYGLIGNKSYNQKDSFSFFNKFKKKQNDMDEQVYYEESILNQYTYDIHMDLITKDALINIDVLRKYHVMFSEKDDRIIFPHYKWNDKNKICGIVGRTVNPNYKALGIKKYISMLPTKYDKTKNLYALCWNIDEIKRTKQIILFEAEKSCMKLETMKLPGNSVSVGCHSISETQLKIILSLGVQEVIIAFDKDVTEDEVRNKCAMFYDYVKVSYIIDRWNFLEEKDSPVDRGLKKWRFMYNHRTIFNGRINKQ